MCMRRRGWGSSLPMLLRVQNASSLVYIRKNFANKIRSRFMEAFFFFFRSSFVHQLPLKSLARPFFLASLLASFMTEPFRWSLYARMSPSHFVTVCFSQIQISSATWGNYFHDELIFICLQTKIMKNDFPQNPESFT